LLLKEPLKPTKHGTLVPVGIDGSEQFAQSERVLERAPSHLARSHFGAAKMLAVAAE
jgi:hypothetical protein